MSKICLDSLKSELHYAYEYHNYKKHVSEINASAEPTLFKLTRDLFYVKSFILKCFYYQKSRVLNQHEY